MEEDHYCSNCQKHVSTSNFATHSAFCERNIKVCKLCNEPIQVSQEKEHLEEFHIVVACDLCNTGIEKWMLLDHEKSCPKRLVRCDYCDGKFPYEDFPEHFEFCSSRTEKCLLCQKYVMLKEKQKHSEIHMFEKKIRIANIDNEVKQNIINEVLSNPTSEQSIQEKIDEVKNSSISSNSVKSIKDKTHFKISIPTGEGACALDTPKEMSKHYTMCHICKQNIPWIDFNTHVPSCASNTGKCARCGEDVPDHEFKEHFLKNCKLLLTKDLPVNKTDLKRNESNRNEARIVAEEHIDVQNMKKCLYCKQLCSSDRIFEHMKDCSENCYECPLCFKKMPESEKNNHESFECSVLLDINSHDGHSHLDAPRNSCEKYKNSSNISKDKITKEGFASQNRSYANAARNSSLQENNKNYSNCKPCCPCYDSSGHKIKQHSFACQKNKKQPCLYCCEEIDVTKEDIHLITCGVFQNISKSEPEGEQSYKGAIPKNSNFAKMVKPLSEKCKFCKTSLNANILIYHMKECIYQPIVCEQCNTKFELKDREKHTCKSKKKRGKHEWEEVKTGSRSGFGRLQNFFGKSENNDKYENSRNSANNFGYDYSESQFIHPGADNTEIPCEFCGELFSASNIILHETGCKPELVALPKKDSQKDKAQTALKKTNVHQQDSMSEKNFFSSESKTNISTSRSRNMKKHKELGVDDENFRPGEFLECTYDPKISEDTKSHQIETDYSSRAPVESVWNINSPNTQASDFKILLRTSFFDKGKKSERDISDEMQKPFEDKHASNSDDEMTEMLEFINEDKTGALHKKVSVEEMSTKYSKDNVLHTMSDQNLYLQGHREGKPENRKSLQHYQATSKFSEETKKAFNDGDDSCLDLKKLKNLFLDTASENKNERKAFTVEAAENFYFEHSHVKKTRGEIEHFVKSNQDVSRHPTSKESHTETSDDDLGK